MYKYKLIASDVDGTLLNSKGIITDDNVYYIRKAIDNGVVFCIASGRAPQSIKPLVDIIKRDIPIIAFNGALALLGESEKIIYQKNLKEKYARKAIELGLLYDTTIIVWKNGCLYVNKFDERAEKYAKLSSQKPELFSLEDHIEKGGVSKVLWYGSTELFNKIQPEVIKQFDNEVIIHPSQTFFLEFVDCKAQKSLAIDTICEKYNIDKKETIAIGDSYNDISMLTNAGLGIAVDNSNDDIKRVADYVSPSNDENAIAYIIKKYVIDK